jgi:hypothetical protein
MLLTQAITPVLEKHGFGGFAASVESVGPEHGGKSKCLTLTGPSVSRPIFFHDIYFPTKNPGKESRKLAAELLDRTLTAHGDVVKAALAALNKNWTRTPLKDALDGLRVYITGDPGSESLTFHTREGARLGLWNVTVNLLGKVTHMEFNACWGRSEAALAALRYPSLSMEAAIAELPDKAAITKHARLLRQAVKAQEDNRAHRARGKALIDELGTVGISMPTW